MRFVNFLIKPASSACNLRCRYCFYEAESDVRAVKNFGVMQPQTVERLLADGYALSEPGGAVHFAFQGGEPTVAGLDFFKDFVARARALCPPRVHISFAIQTNGTLLDEDWAAFLKAEDFLVGLSVDGYSDLHDLYRVDARGRGTFGEVRKRLALLLRHGVRVNALCVVTAQCARRPEKAYNELKKLGVRYMQFIPCLDPMGEERGGQPFSLTPEAYGAFLCRLFDLWYADWAKGDYHSVRLFDDYVNLMLGEPNATCATCGRCGGYFVVEGDGSVYPCDFYAVDEWCMGRLGEVSLAGMADGEKARDFLLWGQQKPAECTACRWRALCNGGCKNDWIGPREAPHNYYCSALQTFFAHAEPELARIAAAERQARMGYGR